MKYLFFDIECANCYRNIGKICEFGYVIMDENFQIIEKRNIFMNPEAKILTRWKIDGEFKEGLTQSIEYYNSQPPFPHFYKEIKELFQRKDYMYFAFSSSNDMNFLAGTINRYHLPIFDFICYDAQKIAYAYAPEEGSMPGLEKMYHKVCIDNIELPPHESSNDAYMTAMIVAEIIREKKTTIIEECKSIQGIKSSLKDVFDYREVKANIDLLKSRVTLPNIKTAQLKQYKKKKYYLLPSLRQNEELFIKTLVQLKKKQLFAVTSLKYTDFVLFQDKEEKIKYKRIRKQVKNRYKFVKLEKLFK